MCQWRHSDISHLSFCRFDCSYWHHFAVFVHCNSANIDGSRHSASTSKSLSITSHRVLYCLGVIYDAECLHITEIALATTACIRHWLYARFSSLLYVLKGWPHLRSPFFPATFCRVFHYLWFIRASILRHFLKTCSGTFIKWTMNISYYTLDADHQYLMAWRWQTGLNVLKEYFNHYHFILCWLDCITAGGYSWSHIINRYVLYGPRFLKWAGIFCNCHSEWRLYSAVVVI